MDVSVLRRRLAGAQPADLVFLAYVAFSGLFILLFGWGLSRGLQAGLIFMHAAMLGAGYIFCQRALRAPSLGGLIRDAYPLLFVTPLYWELRYLAQFFADGYNDAAILRLEEALFGQQLALTFSQQFPYLWLSELFHMFYGLYWAMLPLAVGALYLRKQYSGFRELVYVELVVFFGCYLFYIFYPVAGPFYQFDQIGGHLADGFFYRAIRWVLADGGSMGAAFPSSHVAVAVAILLVTWRHDRAIFAGMLPLVIGLTVGTVYGRFHYGIDALSGVITAVLLAQLAYALRPWLSRFAGLAMGNSRRALAV